MYPVAAPKAHGSVKQTVQRALPTPLAGNPHSAKLMVTPHLKLLDHQQAPKAHGSVKQTVQRALPTPLAGNTHSAKLMFIPHRKLLDHQQGDISWIINSGHCLEHQQGCYKYANSDRTPTCTAEPVLSMCPLAAPKAHGSLKRTVQRALPNPLAGNPHSGKLMVIPHRKLLDHQQGNKFSWIINSGHCLEHQQAEPVLSMCPLAAPEVHGAVKRRVQRALSNPLAGNPHSGKLMVTPHRKLLDHQQGDISWIINSGHCLENQQGCFKYANSDHTPTCTAEPVLSMCPLAAPKAHGSLKRTVQRSLPNPLAGNPHSGKLMVIHHRKLLVRGCNECSRNNVTCCETGRGEGTD